ncbi:hypothetical protein BJV82DRAFT_607071 [Fennellomyces sp. T-0311]|nr:hypothetical protein BJV82DRAFT_607071 [Fennellomyces sp. T-0311]
MALANPTFMINDDVSRMDHCRMIPDRLSSLYRRQLYPEAADDVPSVSYSFPQPTLLALLLSRLLDAVIFTSAIAITAYNYWTGELLNPPQKQQGLLAAAPIVQQQQQQIQYDERKSRQVSNPMNKLVDTRRQRTEEWAECLTKSQQQQQQQQQPRKSTYAQPTLASMSKSQATKQRSKHRSKSFDQPREEQDEMLARMQTQLQNLIQEGQAALTSTVDVYDDEDDYFARRTTRRMKRYHSA